LKLRSDVPQENDTKRFSTVTNKPAYVSYKTFTKIKSEVPEISIPTQQMGLEFPGKVGRGAL